MSQASIHVRVPESFKKALEEAGEPYGQSPAEQVRNILRTHSDELLNDAPTTHYDHLPIKGSVAIGSHTDALNYTHQYETDGGDTVHALRPASDYATYLRFIKNQNDQYRFVETVDLFYDPLEWVTHELNETLHVSTALETDVDHTGESTGSRPWGDSTQ